MVSLGFAFNFNIQRCEIEVGDEKRIVTEGYIPLVDTLLEFGLKADFFLSGYSSRLIAELQPSLIDTIRENSTSSFEIGTYTYTHPIPQLLLPEEFQKQIRKGLEIDKEIFGTTPSGFLPPEFAYSEEMAGILYKEGISWIIILSSLISRSNPQLSNENFYFPYRTKGKNFLLTAVPAVYQLPETPQRFFKLMMKGEIPVEAVIDGIRTFCDKYPDALLLLKRDAETIFIDRINSGFSETLKVFRDFAKAISTLKNITSVRIGDFLHQHSPRQELRLIDHLGNTKLETFTEGEAKPIWDLTRKVRQALIQKEKKDRPSPSSEKAWEHLLLSHNSDGRIGYWYSEWNPGEHTVAPSRRLFIEENLKKALEYIENDS